MHKRSSIFPASPAPSASKVAERLRAHARLCQQIARESRNETIAIELARLADQCVEAADNIEPVPRHRLH